LYVYDTFGQSVLYPDTDMGYMYVAINDYRLYDVAQALKVDDGFGFNRPETSDEYQKRVESPSKVTFGFN
jgi:hypothetical protein